MVYVAYVNKELYRAAHAVASALRRNGLPAEVDLLDRGLKKQLEAAAGRGAAYTVIIGPKELASNRLLLRNMVDGREEAKPLEDIISELKGA